MSRIMLYGPVTWHCADLSGWDAQQAFVRVLNAFGVTHTAGSDNHTEYDYEVNRDELKSMWATLMTGDFDDYQDDEYHTALGVMRCTHDEFITVLKQMLNVRTEWIRVAWA